MTVAQLNAKAMERMFNRPLAKTAKRLGVQQTQIHVLDDNDDDVVYQV
jgi:hypothetical protein